MSEITYFCDLQNPGTTGAPPAPSMGDTRTQLIKTLTIGTLPGKIGMNGIHITEVLRVLSQSLQTTARTARVIGHGHFLPHFSKTTQAITQLSVPTHAQLQSHRLKFIKNHLKNSYMFRSSTIFRELRCPR